MTRKVAAIMFLAAAGAYADNVTLRDGTIVSGSWIGGDRAHITFMVDGQVRTYSRSEVSLVTFGQALAPIAPPPPPAPLAPIAPPPPPPADTQQIDLGQTTAQVEAAFGKPAQILASGTKKIYVYKNPALKITFEDGKVTNIE